MLAHGWLWSSGIFQRLRSAPGSASFGAGNVASVQTFDSQLRARSKIRAWDSAAAPTAAATWEKLSDE
ncbi:hypothetical protein EYF80_005033 [Liparis tanakae]|uniref:Uncharacterized protein n=1 Tax=Liparis tanakae TaxID=230148 RepID=A0A4Z2J4K2_9TELE|nr:hypothetical protein EYF80_005033 [Liparis tanakae]